MKPYTIRLPDHVLDELNKKHIEVAPLVRELLENYLRDNLQNPDKYRMEIQEIRSEVNNILSRLNEMEENLEEKQEEVSAEQQEQNYQEIRNTLHKEVPKSMIPRYREAGVLEEEYQKVAKKLDVDLELVKKIAEQEGLA